MFNPFKVFAEAVEAIEHDVETIDFRSGHFSVHAVVEHGGKKYDAVMTIDEQTTPVNQSGEKYPRVN